MGANTKLEECARAVCQAEGYDPDVPMEHGSTPSWLDFVAPARAVIRCLMEPNPKMNFAGSGVGDYPGDELKPTRVLRAMLQFVLDEAGKE